jgi:hypothetical protein
VPGRPTAFCLLEAHLSCADFNGSFITIANERFGDQRYEKIGLLTGLNYAMQGIGSIIIAPLVKRFPTRSVL